MELLQFLYIVPLNLAYKVTGKIPVKVRHGIIGGSFFVMIAFFLVCYSSPYTGVKLDYGQQGWVNMIPLGIIILMSINRPLKALKWNPILNVPWTFCGGVLVIVCLVFHIGPGFLPFSICMLVLFPCLYLVWNNRRDYEVLFSLVAQAMIANLLLFFLACMIFCPINAETMVSGRYLGPTDNANNLGMITSSSVACCLYLIFRSKKPVPLYMVACAIAVSLLMLSASRTALISICLQMVIFLIFYICYYMKESDKLKAMIKLCLLFVLILSLIPINKVLLSRDLYVNAVHATVRQEQGAQVQKKKEIKDTDKETKEKKKKQNSERKEKKKKQEEAPSQPSQPTLPQEESVLHRFQMEGYDFNQISSGRLNIWKSYAEKLSWKGHTEDQFVLGDEKNRIWAHNVFIEFSYRFGIGIGLLYLFLAVYNGVYVLRCIVSKRFYYEHAHCVFSAFMIVTFCVTSMLEMAAFPLERDFILLYFIGITPLFRKPKQRRHGYSGKRKMLKNISIFQMIKRLRGKRDYEKCDV
ncbi:MAG: hypothetical protein HFE75_16570 [Firmicutes bacterium]|nr:hypothetical protein [Bacillota bacterium]